MWNKGLASCDFKWKVMKFIVKLSIQMIVWNSLHNEYAERSEAFTLLKTKILFKNYEAFFAFYGVILGVSNISFDNGMQ